MIKKTPPFAPALAWGIFIFVLSVLPGKDFPQLDWGDLLSVDKIVHLLFYFLLTWLIVYGKMKSTQAGQITPIFIIGAAIFSTLYGWALEWIQENYCTDRVFDALDGVANTIGATVAAAILWFRKKRVINNE